MAKQGRPHLDNDQLRKANILASQHAARAREKNGGQPNGEWSGQDWLDLLDEYDHCCVYCGERFPPNQLTADHAHPLARGGTNALENIRPACRPCNTQKGTYTPLDFWLRTRVPNGAEILRLRRELRHLRRVAEREADEQQGGDA